MDRGEGLVLVDARELTAMGYPNVRDYVAGKKDWIDAGLPAEGSYYERRRERNP